MRNRFLVAALAICVCAFCLSGCGSKKPKMVHVTGSVKVAGELVETGSITFKPDDGQGIDTGAPIKDGAFEAAIAGNVMITRIVITDTIRCVRPDDVWTQLGVYEF